MAGQVKSGKIGPICRRNRITQNTRWLPYHEYYRIITVDNGRSDAHDSTVVGDIQVAPRFYSPELDNRRDILVYLPPGYASSDQRYPVLYMQDGQNLFDNATSFAGEWGVDETMESLAEDEGLKAIVVGLPNTGKHRIDEYSPFHSTRYGGGKGDSYLDFIVQTVKPEIDRRFRTRRQRSATGIMGSSMGGLISLVGFFNYPGVFGFAGVMSPALWFADGAMYEFVEQAEYHPGRIYLDAGTRELGEDLTLGLPHRATSSRRYYAGVRRMKRMLIRKGYRPVHDLMHVEEKWADHGETAWARRLPAALRFFLTSPHHQNPLQTAEYRQDTSRLKQ